MDTAMYDVFLFAGTTEGRTLAEALRHSGRRICVFTATEYGGSLIPSDASMTVISERLDEAEMEERIRTQTVADAWVIDATHPYAAIVTQNIKAAAEATGRRYLRVLRDTSDELRAAAGSAEASDASEGQVVFVQNVAEAAEYLTHTEGNVLLTTGSKELAAFTVVPDFEHRLFARVLSLPKVAAACDALGFRGRNLICMQGPFSEELNVAMLHQIHATWLVTKETGREGGFPEKIAAANACGCKLLIIGKPSDEPGISLAEAIQLLTK